MSAGNNIENQEREAKLLPVTGAIVLCYLVLLTAGYFIGNLIYQIP